ncbi:Hypothetical protein NTJ_11211 [Nesidiocoris tenuis]|uniref:Cilia- and flagella-associated protein 43 n=1 Tax=Nesidiocoris tenuis TaxID=355587 RepID=A0ABN7B1V9_9HEMI|nr:Hypothetical protein NTJ_11211 [Nesidiocoris tenuis]
MSLNWAEEDLHLDGIDSDVPSPGATQLFPSRSSGEGDGLFKKEEEFLAENWDVDVPQIAENVPWFSAMSTFEDDPLILNGSYGYNGDGLNLCVVEPDKLVWQAGNIIHILDVKQRHLAFRRSAFGQDIASICKAASKNLLAVCENGGTKEGCHPPSIIVYEWPDFSFRCWFKGGTDRTYKSVDINSVGTCVAFVGDDPHRLTVRHFIRRKTQVSNERAAISRVVFSPYDPKFLVTYGRGYLKFWLLNASKLVGASANVADMDWEISALSFLPDSRTITNMDDGYLAIWEPSGKLQCLVGLNSSGFVHSTPIFIRLYVEEKLLYTADQDGIVRVWDAKNVCNTRFKTESPRVLCQVDPRFERTVKNIEGIPAKLKQVLPKQFAEYPFHFYAQDANQGIWLLDLALKKKPDLWTCVNPCQTSLVIDVSPSPADYYLAVLSERLNIFCHQSRTVLASKQLPEPGSCILWLPLHLDPDGRRALVGFESGVLRLVAILVKMGGSFADIDWIQSLRPHSSSVTVLTVHKDLIVSGSEDGSIFLYYFSELKLVPVGMIRMPGPVCHIAWNQFRTEEYVILVSCKNGIVVEAVVSDEDLVSVDMEDSRDTYLLSVSQVETQAIGRSQSKKPRSYFSKYLAESIIWIEDTSTTHRYHNLAYEVGQGPVAKLNISEGRVVHSYVDLLSGKYVVLGTDIGTLKVIRVGEFSEPDTFVNGFLDSWESKMHRTDSSITKLCLSHDQRILYSCGTDCAIFAYKVNLVADPEVKFIPLHLISQPYEYFNQSIAPDVSLEVEKSTIRQKRLSEARQVEVNQIKAEVLKFLENYYELYELNKSLPKSLRIPELFFRLDTPEDREKKRAEAMKKRHEEITAPLEDVVGKLFESARNLNRKFVSQIKTSNFYLFAIRGPYYLKSFPEKRLYETDPFGDDDLAFVDWKKQWGSTFGDRTSRDDQTDFEQLVGNVVSLLTVENKRRKFSDSLNRLAKKNLISVEVADTNEGDDHITSAGNFLIEHDKFILRDKHLFQKLDKIRVKKLKHSNELKNLRVVEKKLVQHLDLVRAALGNVLKLEKKNEERFPSVLERLVDLLNIRQLIYLKKESFNTKLKSLRREKIRIFNYDYWARKEVEYMTIDMNKRGIEFNVKMPKAEVDIVWDLECPEMSLKRSVGPVPASIAERLSLHQQESVIIEYLNSILECESMDVTPEIMDIALQRKTAFQNSVVIVKETLDRMIIDFEERLFELLLARKGVADEVAQLRKEYAAIEAEVDILHRFSIMETKTFNYREEILVGKYYYSFRENVKQRRIKSLNDSIKERQRAIDDINARFAAMVKDDKWAKHLSRTYRKKLKMPRGSASEDSGSSESESSSDDDDDGYDDLLTDEDSMSSAAGVAYLYDETVIPPGCDEEKFRSMFHLRLLRHGEESKIAEFRKAREAMLRECSQFHRQAMAADACLGIFHSRLHRYKETMKYELGDVRSRMKLKKWTTQEELEPGSLEDKFWIIRDDNKAHMATLKILKESGRKSEAETAIKIRNVRSRIARLEELASKDPLEGMEEILDAKWRTVAEADQVLNEILASMIKKGLYQCAREIEAKERLAQRALDAKALSEKKEKLRQKKRLQLIHVKALYEAEVEKNRQLQKTLQDQKKGVAKNKYYHC